MKRIHPLLPALLALAAALFAAPAEATRPRCKLERIDPSTLEEGKLRVYASVVELEGEVIGDVPSSAFTLLVNGKKKGKADKLQRFNQVKETVDVVLVVEVAAQFKEALESVKAALKEFLQEQPPSLKVKLITYGSEISSKTPFMASGAMADQVEAIELDEDSGDVRMTDAVRAAMTELKKLEKPRPLKSDEDVQIVPRRLIVLVSDGLNNKMDRLTFKKLGEDAARAQIPIHTIAYSPLDSRGPLLNLGDLSKRSNGTFRWAQKAEDLKPQLDTLAEEVRGQYVLTFPVDIDSVKKYTFGLVCRDLRSNPLRGDGVPTVAGASSRKGLAWYWWVIIGVGGLLFLVLILFLVGSIMQKRQARMGMQPGVPTAAAGGVPLQQRPGYPQQQQYPQQPQYPQQGAGMTGQRPAVAPSGAVGAVAGAPVRSGMLIAVTGALAGQRCQINARHTVGSAPGNFVVIPGDPTVAPQHCELRFDQIGLIVIDYGSPAGTYVNGRRIAQPTRMGDGDIVRVGESSQFKFRAD